MAGRVGPSAMGGWLPAGLQVGTEQGQVGGGEPVPGGLRLVPVGVDERRRAHLVQLLPLRPGEGQPRRRQGVRQLVGGPRADYHRGDGGPAQGVGERDLAGETPRCAPIPASTSIVSYRASPSYTGGSPQSVSCREPAGACSPRRYLPDSRPPASGLQTSTPRPWSMASGISSYSASRACSTT